MATAWDHVPVYQRSCCPVWNVPTWTLPFPACIQLPVTGPGAILPVETDRVSNRAEGADGRDRKDLIWQDAEFIRTYWENPVYPPQGSGIGHHEEIMHACVLEYMHAAISSNNVSLVTPYVPGPFMGPFPVQQVGMHLIRILLGARGWLAQASACQNK